MCICGTTFVNYETHFSHKSKCELAKARQKNNKTGNLAWNMGQISHPDVELVKISNNDNKKFNDEMEKAMVATIKDPKNASKVFNKHEQPNYARHGGDITLAKTGKKRKSNTPASGCAAASANGTT